MSDKRQRMTWLGMAAGALTAFAVLYGCGSSSDDSSGNKDASSDVSEDGPSSDSGADVKANCQMVGTTCASDSDCCSASCDPTLHACVNPVGTCKAQGAACAAPTECCTMVCSGGTCGGTVCTSDNQACTTDAQCCGGKCGPGADGGPGVCQPLNPACSTSGNTCNGNADCCSQYCSNGRCSGQPSFCTQTGDACANDFDCCTGICTMSSGATLGTCAQPTAPGTTGCLVAGQVCSGGATGTTDGGIPACGGDCCSRSCAPYGPTHVLVCQPPSGCHPTGEICVKDTDCCGAPGVPGGNGTVRCSKGAGEAVGRCDNGQACRASGAVCKLATGSCNAENNCCTGNVNQDPSVCKQDLLGIPRCTSAGSCDDAGSKAGQACATSADCCGLPCVPNTAGDGGAPFICGSSCAKSGGACTIDADCCSGLPCNAPPGSTQGVCGYLPGPDAGSDGSTPDAGTDGSTCALYGQQCTTASDCCDGTPCNGGRCVVIVPK